MKSSLKVVLGLLLLSGCAAQTRSQEDTGDMKRQLTELQKTQGVQAAQIEELNQKILLLSESKKAPDTKSQMPAVPDEKAEMAPVLPKAEVPDVSIIAVKEIKDSKDNDTSGAEKLYQQVVTEARQGKLNLVQKNVSLLMKGYKESPWTNNALYLLGEKLFEQGQYLKAAEQFETLYKTFPDGNKAVSALYKLGVCYEKLGKPDEAQEAFQNVISVYPGSREAQLAQRKVSSSETAPGSKAETEE